MTNRNAGSRFDGQTDRVTIEGRPLPYQSGVLPEDFTDRLHRFKEASGLTWNGLRLVQGSAELLPVRRGQREMPRSTSRASFVLGFRLEHLHLSLLAFIALRVSYENRVSYE